MRQRQVQEVAGKRGLDGGARRAQPAVVGFRAGDDVLDVGIAGAAEVGAGVRPVDRPAECGHDLGFYGLGIGIVTRMVGRTAVFRCDGEAAIGLGGGG